MHAADRGCALVTGGSRGIGAAIAKGLAADGWPVAVNYLESAEAAAEVVATVRERGGTAIPLRADVADPATAESLCARAESELGRPILVLVNNAGIAANRLSLQMDESSWQSVIETNLSAAHRLARRGLRSMFRERFGRVINVSSAAVFRPSPGQTNYVAAKEGLIGLTRALAVEVASRSITVNAIVPGLIDTDLGAESVELLLSAIPAGRIGAPEEVASCARFLASEAAGYVTGSTLTVDGGLSISHG